MVPDAGVKNCTQLQLENECLFKHFGYCLDEINTILRAVVNSQNSDPIRIQGLEKMLDPDRHKIISDRQPRFRYLFFVVVRSENL